MTTMRWAIVFTVWAVLAASLFQGVREIVGQAEAQVFEMASAR